jgi:hypothetical protein
MSYRANDALAACLRRLLACAASVTASPPAPNRRPRWWGPARALRLAIEHNDPATERRRCERDLLKVLMASLASEDYAAEKNHQRQILPGVRHD